MTRPFFVLLLTLIVTGLAAGGDETPAKARTKAGSLGKRPEPAKLVLRTSMETLSGANRLFEQEIGALDVIVLNRGELPAEQVVVKTFPGRIEGVTIDSLKSVGDIPPGDSVRARFLISTSGRMTQQSIHIPVAAADAAGNTVATWSTLTLALRSSQPAAEMIPVVPSRGRTWMLVIGVNDYQHWPRLENATADAQAIRAVLTEYYGIRNEYIIELYDREATRSNIFKKLEYLAKTVKPEDNVLVYYAGHGKYDEMLNRGYWVPADAEIGSTAHYIANSDLQTFVAAIRSRATLVISDACFSGTVFRDDAAARPVHLDDVYIRRVSLLKARQAIVSGGDEPVMDSGISGKHSVFAYYLLDRLMKNQDRYLAASSLFDRIRIPITNSSPQTPQLKPIHNTGDEGGEFVFVRSR
jgi:hypothetical protein